MTLICQLRFYSSDSDISREYNTQFSRAYTRVVSSVIKQRKLFQLLRKLRGKFSLQPSFAPAYAYISKRLARAGGSYKIRRDAKNESSLLTI